MRSGKLRRPCQLQKPDETRGANGEMGVSWKAAGQIWVEFSETPPGPGSQVHAQQPTSVQRRSAEIRFREDVSTLNRIVDGPITYRIVDLVPAPKRDKITVLLETVGASVEG